MKVILFANTDWYLYNFRLPLAHAIRAQGNEVVLLSPPGNYVKRIEDAGFHWKEFSIERSSTNFIKEGLSLLRLRKLYMRERPDLVHHFTIKPVIYGSIAAGLAGIPVIVNSITGLGTVFAGRHKILKILISNLYRIVLRWTWVIFQNPDDQSVFLENKWVNAARVALIRSSGVDTKQFSPSPEPKGIPVVILPARLLWDKGVGEFVEAAQILKKRGVDARFVLVGSTDTGNPSTVPFETLKKWQEKNLIECWGWQENMVETYHQATLVCLPSYYKEGVPKTLVEAAACGCAIITTNTPGCREIVRHGENGLLVPARDPLALADALQSLIADPSMRRKMGKAGRKIAVQEFDVRNVVRATLEWYDCAFTSVGGLDGN